MCYKCGSPVEDGISFCPQCGAPQIRVDMGDTPATPPLPPGTPDQLQPPARPVPVATQPGAPTAAGRIEWHAALSGSVAAAVLLALCWMIPGASLCLWTLAGGAVAVLLYQRRRPVTVTPGMGARLGAVTGLLAFVVFAIVTSLELLATRGGNLRTMLVQVLQQAAARNPNPEVQRMMERMTSPEGLALLVTLGMIMIFVAFLSLSAVGGAIGAALFGRREK